MRWSTSAFRILGMPSDPARFSSISSPMRFLGRSNLRSDRSLSSPARHWVSFSRYACRSDAAKAPATTFSPIEGSLLEWAARGTGRSYHDR